MARKAYCPAIRKNGIMQSAASRNMSCRTTLCAIQSAVIFAEPFVSTNFSASAIVEEILEYTLWNEYGFL